MEGVVPNHIKEILERRRAIAAFPYTFTQVAAVADVSRNTLWNLSQGLYWPKLDTAYRIARAMSTTVYEIWAEAEVIGFLMELTEAEQERIMKELVDESQEE